MEDFKKTSFFLCVCVCVCVCVCIFFLRWSLVLSPRLEYSGANSAYYNLILSLPGSRDSSALASRVSEITGMCHHAWLIFIVSVEMGFHHVGQAGLELLGSSHLTPRPPKVLEF